MINKKMINLINDRIEEMINDRNIQRMLMKLKKEKNKTDTEIQELITQMAIATLYGIN